MEKWRAESIEQAVSVQSKVCDCVRRGFPGMTLWPSQTKKSGAYSTKVGSSLTVLNIQAEATARATVDGYRDEMEALRKKNVQLEQVHQRLQREKNTAATELDRITVCPQFFATKKRVCCPYSATYARKLSAIFRRH